MKIYLLTIKAAFIFVSTSLLSTCNSANQNSNNLSTPDSSMVLIGTYTYGNDGKPNESKGIYIYSFNYQKGELSFISTSPKTENPSFLAISPSKKFIYCVNELADSTGGGYLSSFNIAPDQKSLTFINRVSSMGSWPCHISIDNSGKFVMDANYGNGVVALYSINPDGALSEAKSIHRHLPKATDGPEVKAHAHMILQDKYNQNVFSSDLGTDMIWTYTLDTIKQVLAPSKIHIPTQSKAGPRHFEFHPLQPWVYVINELNGTIEAFNSKANFGYWERFQTISTLEPGQSDTASCADIHISPSGKYLYASNRAGVNNIAMYQINQQSGELKLMGHQFTGGKTPRNFAIDPSGKYMLVANQNSNNIVIFKIDNETGWIENTGKSVAVPAPVCIKFL
jgi:6-phosphogluconolactonase